MASGIAFGFVHQCQTISRNTKVLACAFSNVGADNLAEQMVQLGLKVVRIGKASAVSESLWDYTLDAAIDKDPAAQKALQNAAWATSQLTSSKTQRKGESRSKSSILSERTKREVATIAVKASIEVSRPSKQQSEWLDSILTSYRFHFYIGMQYCSDKGS